MLDLAGLMIVDRHKMDNHDGRRSSALAMGLEKDRKQTQRGMEQDIPCQ